MHCKSNEREIMIGSDTDKITEGHFDWLPQMYQIGLEKWVKSSDSAIYSIYGLFYQCLR